MNRATSAQTDIHTPCGTLHLLADTQALWGCWFDNARNLHPQAGPTPWVAATDHPVLQQACTELALYFQNPQHRFSDKLCHLGQGTVFQRRVWEALRQIPAGRTCSYAELASALGCPQAVRAVAQAVGRNPFSVWVPCHRVLGQNGALRGYHAGLERKRWLLDWEAASVWTHP